MAAGSVGLGVSGTGTGVAIAATVGAAVGGSGVGSCPQAIMPTTATAAPQINSDVKRRTTTNFSNLLGFPKSISILTQYLAAASSGNPDIPKIDFDSAGRAIAYISLDQALNLALRHARDNKDFYGRPYRDLFCNERSHHH